MFDNIAAIYYGIEVQGINSECHQHVVDNVDHNIYTLYGRNAFCHMMGIIAAVTPELKVTLKSIRQIIDPKNISKFIPSLEVSSIEARMLPSLLTAIAAFVHS